VLSQSSSEPITTPVLVIGFNRPDKLLNLLARLESLGVRNLFVSLDGPRNSTEAAACNAAREQVELFKDRFNLSIVWRDYNLGCCLGVVAALDWFYEQNSAGIVLEDDCYPEDDMLVELQRNLSLLNKTTSKVGLLTAHNPFLTWPSHQISRYFLIHGWATTAKIWKEVRAHFFRLTFPQISPEKRLERSLSESIFWWANSSRARLGGVDTWDGIFSDRMWRLGYRTHIPKNNLIRNLGFDDQATHTKDPCGSIFVEVEENEKNNFDSLMKLKYFKIGPKHFFTAPIKVLFDFFSFKRVDYESILKLDKRNRNESSFRA
jgi:hypothetical protein